MEPRRSYPRRGFLRDDLFVCVHEQFMTETARVADVVLPAAGWGEKTGTFTNVNRTVHLSEQAVEPPGEARSDLWFTFHLGRLIRERLAGSGDEADRPVLALTWDYPVEGPLAEPDAEAVLAEAATAVDAAAEGVAVTPLDRSRRLLLVHAHPDDETLMGATLYKLARELGANVDLALAATAHAHGMRPDAGEAVFAVARTVGWISHWLEMHSGPYKIGRPRQLYTGYTRRDFVSVDKR